MRDKTFIKKWGINILLVISIVGVSIYYSTGKGFMVFSNILEENKSIPIHSVETAEKVVAITINVGFGKQYTKEILEVLEDEGVKVSFFVMGSWIDRYKEDLLMIHKSDHEIGNNSSTYPHLTKLKREQIIGEVNECSEKIKEISMDEARIFRPPYGDYNDISQKAINDIGYYPIIWDVDSQDNSEKLSEEISDTILKQVSNGSIILFHNNSEKTKDALKDSIRQLKKSGYKFLKVSDIIYKNNYYVDHTGRQININ